MAVLNAGSSSIKFSLFVTRSGDLEVELRGQVEGIYNAPHFIAKKPDGTKATEKFWPSGTALGHDGAPDHLIEFLRSQLAQRFALPEELHEAGMRRYGFHGLSYEYIASALVQFDAKAASGKTIVLHLGNGASMCAIEAGRSMASTMGFTVVEGLPMGTRSGSLDPGVILYLMDQRGMGARAIEKVPYNESGLLAVSGIVLPRLLKPIRKEGFTQ